MNPGLLVSKNPFVLKADLLAVQGMQWWKKSLNIIWNEELIEYKFQRNKMAVGIEEYEGGRNLKYCVMVWHSEISQEGR